MSTQSETNERLARIEEQLKGIRETLIPLASIPTQVALNQQAIEDIRTHQKESRRLRWRSITAIVTAILSSIAALITALFRN